MSNIRIAGAQNNDFLAYRTHKLMKNLFFTAVLMSAGFLFTSQAEAREGSAMVRTVSGEATMSIDGKNWSPLKVGTVLRTGATVKTSKDAQADLFLGLNGIVVKSHGGADALGFASAIDIAYEFAYEDIAKKIIKNISKKAFKK